MVTALKAGPQLFALPSGFKSDILTTSAIPNNAPRTFYLQNPSLVPPPIISASEFVPRPLIEHLMRKKKDSAIGVKFEGGGGDEITNMEGALHTFVTPVMRAIMTGDYKFSIGHGVVEFGNQDGKQRVRNVVVSALIQMDFELPTVMLELCRLREQAVVGNDIQAFNVPSADAKQSDDSRSIYDERLRRHMIYHLTKDHRLPALHMLEARAMDMLETRNYLEESITAAAIDSIENDIATKFLELPNRVVVSVELLFNTATHQLRNELSALEAMCPQGYVYTYDPPSIFARIIGPTILNRVFILALRSLSWRSRFKEMRIFAFNNYADRPAVPMVRKALEMQAHVVVCSKSDLFQGHKGTYDLEKAGSSISKAGKAALLVVHNNSDAFGQNIETELSGGSLDGAIGAYSSAAASLARERQDLLKYVF